MAAQTPPTTLGVMEQALFASAPRVRIGRFEVERQLGRGGMGVVYLARDPKLKRSVAIKVHREQEAGAGASRLRREAEALAQLRHRNVVTIHEVGETDDDVYLVMEYLPGPNLRAWIAEEKPDGDAVLDVLARCARALAAGHRRGVVHRDFKPDNVVIDDDGEPRIVDFGLATPGEATPQTPSVAPDTPVTRAGTTPGTPRYMAPELFEGAAASAATDQFAWGITALECLVGAPPFDGRAFVLPARPRGISAARWAVLRRTVSPRPEARFASMAAVVDALQRATRRRARLAAAAGVAVVAVGGGAIGWGVVRDPTPVAVGSHTEARAVAPCLIGTDLLRDAGRWDTTSSLVSQDDEGLHLRLPAGAPNGAKARLLEFPVSFQDRAVEFEVSPMLHAGTTNELFLSLENAEQDAFSIVVYHGRWVFPMAPNTHDLRMDVDPGRHRFFRISVKDQKTMPDLVAFEYSVDGQRWTPIARVEGSLSDARVSVAVKSSEPIARDDGVTIRAARCVALPTLAPLAPERDRARWEDE